MPGFQIMTASSSGRFEKTSLLHLYGEIQKVLVQKVLMQKVLMKIVVIKIVLMEKVLAHLSARTRLNPRQ